MIPEGVVQRRYFLYTPRSGSRLLGPPGWGVSVHTRPWGDGDTAEKACGSHDINAYDVVRVDTAAPTHWWRDEGRTWLRLVVREAGGCAADERGTLVYYAPTPQAARSARIILAQLADAHDGADDAARLRLEVACEVGLDDNTTGWVAAERALTAARDTRLDALRCAVADRLDPEGGDPDR